MASAPRTQPRTWPWIALLGLWLAAVVAVGVASGSLGFSETERATLLWSLAAVGILGIVLSRSVRERNQRVIDEETAARSTREALIALGDEWSVTGPVNLPDVDVDVVAAGPGAVLAAEAKHCPRPVLVTSEGVGLTGRPLEQARRKAAGVAAAARDAGAELPVVPALVLWGPGAPELPRGAKRVGDVLVLSGPQADEWRADLSAGRRVSPEQVELVRKAVATPRKARRGGGRAAER